MKKLIKTLILIFVVPTTVNAQLQIGREPDVPSAQTWDFIKYGNAKANLHTGMINITIPFYTYKDNDFEIPISFDYASDGFKPNSLSGILGHDWVLNVGGCITREVRGIPDDVKEHIRIPAYMMDEIWYSDNICKGFYYLHKSGISENDLDFNFTLNNKDDVISYYSTGNSPVYYDVEPDIFHFNFMGYSGSFYLWYKDKIKVYHANTYNGEFKITLTINEYYKYSSFEITTGDGYRYVFGNSDYTGQGDYPGTMPNIGLDFNKKTDPFSPSDDSSYPVIKTWKLIKIIAPNRRVAEFNYMTTERLDKNGNRATDIKEYYPASTLHGYALYNEDGQDCSFPEQIKNINKIDSCSLYTDYLTSINIDGIPYINFFYKEIKGERVKYITNNSWDMRTKQIDSLYLKLDSINTPWTSCSFSYKYPTFNNTNYPLNKIPFLDSIKISGEGSYVFEYYNREDKQFPYMGTFSLDHWGYYNGNNESNPPTDLSTIFTDDIDTFDEKIKSEYAIIREPVPACAIMGTLGWIKYPAGGYSVLHYEPHKYSAAVRRVYAYNYEPTVLNVLPEKITGGLRIKKIDNYTDNNTIAESTSYIYEKEDGTESGTLIHFPRYGINYEASSTAGTKVYYHKSLMDIWSYDKSHIEYSRIIEKKADNSSIIYNYPDYSSVPNKFASGSSVGIPTRICYNDNSISMAFYELLFSKRNMLINILTSDMSMFNERNRLIKKDIISDNGELLRSEKWRYNSSIGLDSHRTYNIAGEDYIISNLEASNSPLEQASVSNYFGNGDSINENTTYTYNSVGQTARISATDSKGNIKNVMYEYVTDLPNPTGILDTMKQYNLIDYPLSEKVYLNGVLSEGKQYRYKSVYNPNLNQKIIVIAQIESYDKEKAVWETDTKYNHYDKYGNLLEIENRNGIKTCYLWGYGGRYLIAKISNCSLTQIKNINGFANIETTLIQGAINNYESILREIQEAEITTFYYEKFSRLTKTIDTAGHITTYDYKNEQHGKIGEMTNELGKFTKYNYSTDEN
jgi:hypothetical protein